MPQHIKMYNKHIFVNSSLHIKKIISLNHNKQKVKEFEVIQID